MQDLRLKLKLKLKLKKKIQSQPEVQVYNSPTKKNKIDLITWISFIAENWKYCSKIIFKCMNSAVIPIFNESFAEKKICR